MEAIAGITSPRKVQRRTEAMRVLEMRLDKARTSLKAAESEVGQLKKQTSVLKGYISGSVSLKKDMIDSIIQNRTADEQVGSRLPGEF